MPEGEPSGKQGEEKKTAVKADILPLPLRLPLWTPPHSPLDPLLSAFAFYRRQQALSGYRTGNLTSAVSLSSDFRAWCRGRCRHRPAPVYFVPPSVGTAIGRPPSPNPLRSPHAAMNIGIHTPCRGCLRQPALRTIIAPYTTDVPVMRTPDVRPYRLLAAQNRRTAKGGPYIPECRCGAMSAAGTHCAPLHFRSSPQAIPLIPHSEFLILNLSCRFIVIMNYELCIMNYELKSSRRQAAQS